MKVRGAGGRLPILAAAIIAAGLLGACGSTTTRTNESLERARAELGAAVGDPLVGRHARAELESAQDAFAQAERDWRRRSDAQVVSHWAYLAEQRAATARAAARLRHTEEQIQAAESERQLAATRRVEAEPVPAAEPGSGTAETQPTRAPSRDVVVVFTDDQFQQGLAALDPRADPGIERLAGLLREDPQRIVRLESHTDDTGSRSRSLDLSGRRADAVRAALVARGIEARRIVVRALGDSYPVASNETAIGRERNRRVEALVSSGPRSGSSGN